MPSKSTTVNVKKNELRAMELLSVITDLYHVLGSDGLLPIVRELRNEISPKSMSTTGIRHMTLELGTSFYIAEVLSPSLQDCSSRKDNELIKKYF